MKGITLRSMEGCNIMLDYYKRVREILTERFGNPSIIKRELQLINQIDRGLRLMVGTIGRVLK